MDGRTTTRFKGCLASLLATLLLATLVGCGTADPQDRLVGTWRGSMELDSQAVQQHIEKAGSGFTKQIAENLVKSMEATSMTIEFRGDGTMDMNAESGGEANRSQGAWELVNAEGNAVTIRSTEVGGTPRVIDMTFESPDEFTIAPPGGPQTAQFGKMRFTRMR